MNSENVKNGGFGGGHALCFHVKLFSKNSNSSLVCFFFEQMRADGGATSLERHSSALLVDAGTRKRGRPRKSETEHPANPVRATATKSGESNGHKKRSGDNVQVDTTPLEIGNTRKRNRVELKRGHTLGEHDPFETSERPSKRAASRQMAKHVEFEDSVDEESDAEDDDFSLADQDPDETLVETHDTPLMASPVESKKPSKRDRSHRSRSKSASQRSSGTYNNQDKNESSCTANQESNPNGSSAADIPPSIRFLMRQGENVHGSAPLFVPPNPELYDVYIRMSGEEVTKFRGLQASLKTQFYELSFIFMKGHMLWYKMHESRVSLVYGGMTFREYYCSVLEGAQVGSMVHIDCKMLFNHISNLKEGDQLELQFLKSDHANLYFVITNQRHQVKRIKFALRELRISDTAEDGDTDTNRVNVPQMTSGLMVRLASLDFQETVRHAGSVSKFIEIHCERPKGGEYSFRFSVIGDASEVQSPMTRFGTLRLVQKENQQLVSDNGPDAFSFSDKFLVTFLRVFSNTCIISPNVYIFMPSDPGGHFFLEFEVGDTGFTRFYLAAYGERDPPTASDVPTVEA